MRQSFDWSDNIGDFFFNGLTINTPGSMAALCIVLAIIAIIYESIKVHSAKVRARAARERQRASSCAPSETANLISSDMASQARIAFPRKFCKLFSEALVFFCHNSLAYALMLSVMIFNGYVFVTVVLGMGLGYFLFGHISMRVNMENMQARTTNVICSPVCPEGVSTSSTPGQSAHHGSCDQITPSTSTNPQPTQQFYVSSETSSVTDSSRL